MKKATNVKNGSSVSTKGTTLAAPTLAKMKGSKRGRKKEKTQISVRLDKALMDVVYHHIGETKERITDCLERGMLLVMQRDFKASPATAQARFIAASADRPTRECMTTAAVVYNFDQVFELDSWEAALRRHFLDYLDWVRRDARYAQVLEHLGRSSPDEEEEEDPAGRAQA